MLRQVELTGNSEWGARMRMCVCVWAKTAKEAVSIGKRMHTRLCKCVCGCLCSVCHVAKIVSLHSQSF